MESSRDGDDALGLEADVEQDLVLVDLDDRALDDVAVVELDDGGVDGVLERGAAEVVLDDGTGDVLPRLVEGAHGGIGEQGDGAGDLTGRRGGACRRVSCAGGTGSFVGHELQNSLSGSRHPTHRECGRVAAGGGQLTSVANRPP